MDTECYLPVIIKLKQQAEQAKHRRLLVLSGERSWVKALALGVIKQLSITSALWLTDSSESISDESSITFSSAKKAIRHLGSERPLIVMDAYAGFHPDGFGAISGTLQAGGLFILLTPDTENWSSYDDPDYERITSLPFCRSELKRRFISRIVSAVCSNESVLHLRQAVSPPVVLLFEDKPTHQSPVVALPNGCLTQDQQLAVDAICNVVTGHRRRPLVITSDRGRGKSAALGLAAAKLIKQGVARIVLTAPFVESVESTFLMLEGQFPHGLREGLSFSIQQAGAQEVTFVAPDELVLKSPDADLVLVDEAAAIPTPMLEALLKRYSRIVFASTIHGYEGTGRGFAVRFTKVLDQQTPQWRQCYLKSPIRWSANDPLEQFVFNALLLNASPVEPNFSEQIKPELLECRWLDQHELSQNEALLNQVFGLLVLAHYRTSPDDLRMLLDGPSLRIVAHIYDSNVVAVALVIREGGLDRTLGDAIWRGERRPRGHLIPQVLSGFGGFQEATDLTGDRVMRIAVHPKLHQLGLGSHLINEIVNNGVNEGVDYIGASFGATPELIDFWQHIGFSPLRLGLQQEAASGAHSVVMMKPISTEAKRLCGEAEQRFTVQFYFDLSDIFSQLNVEIVRRLFRSAEFPELMLSKRDLSDLNAFTEHRRIYESCSMVISKLVMLALINDALADVCTTEELHILVRRVIQKNSSEAIVSEFHLTGKKELNDALRSAVRTLFLRYSVDVI